MKTTLRKLMVIMLILTVTMAFSGIAAFADDGTSETVLEVQNNYSMFQPKAASLIEQDGVKTLVLTYSSTSYDKAYAGTALDAVLIADESRLSLKTNDKFYIPVDVTNVEFPVAFHSVKNEGWYDRIFYIDTENNKLITDTTGGAIVPDNYGDGWDEEVSVTSSTGMFKVSDSKVIVKDDGTAIVKFKSTGSETRQFPKIALISQEASVEEKEAKAIIGTKEGDYDYIYTFTVDIEDLGKDIDVSHYQDPAGEWHNWSKQQTLTINSSEVVNQLITKIQIQKNNEYTERYITAAKSCWDALSDEDKEKDDGYFSEDTGDASKDDPLNAAPDKKKELLVVSFGTSFNDSRVDTIGAVEKKLAAEYGGEYAVRRAFTAQIIINHIQSRDGEAIDNVKQAMDKAVASGVTKLIVQPTHLMSGAEYDELKEEIDNYVDRIDITYAKPLLNSDEDKEIVAKAVAAAAAADAGYASVEEAVSSEDTAFVFMGHGTEHSANSTYEYMQETMTNLGYKNCFIGTVEGKPESTEVNTVLAKVQAAGYTKVILRPLMVVAGDHANNDMAGDDEDSWKSIFAGALGEGNVSTQIRGLGEISEVQDLYAAHTAQAIEESRVSVKDAKIASVSDKAYTGKAIKPTPKVTYKGTTLKKDTDYTLSYKNNTKVGTATITVKGKGDFKGTATKTFKIVKAKNTLTVKAKTATVKYSKVKSAKQTISRTKVLTVSKAKGTVTYTKVSGSKNITIAKSTGKVTVKKGTKKGTYKIKVKVKAAGTSSYKALTKTVTFTIKVK